jgi:hypothetical protein
VSGQDRSAALPGLCREGPANSYRSPSVPHPGARWVGANPEPPLEDGRAPHRQPPPREEVNRMRRPSLEELQRQVEEDGGGEATDGCWVEPDGTCDHGQPSWLLALGLI